ncbi:MAG: TRAP transporter substrate-binding protein [Pseudomonadota bacterium]
MPFRALAFIALFVPALFAPAQVSAETMVVTSQYGPGRPQTLFWERFEEILDEQAPGRFDIRLVVGGALGGEKEEAEAIRLGSIEGALSTVANLTTWVPLGAVLDLPFVFEDTAHIARALDGPLGERLRGAYAAEGFYVPAFIVFGARHIIGGKAYETPEDLEGLTMRSLQSDLHIAMWRSLGANPTALPITEAYGALSTGVVDGMDMTKSGFDALKLHEAAPILTETAHIYAVGVVYFDVAFIEGLPEGDRALITQAAQEAATHFDALAAAEQEAALARAIDAGAERVEVDQAPWRAALEGFARDKGPELAGEEALAALEWIEAAREPAGEGDTR